MRVAIFALLIAVFMLSSGCISDSQPTKDAKKTDEGPKISEPIEIGIIEVEEKDETSTDPCQDRSNVLQKDDCYNELASAYADKTYCDKIYTLDVRDECLYSFSDKDSTICSKISDPQLREDCFDESARKFNDTQLCTKITDNTRKQKCLIDLSPPCTFEDAGHDRNLCLAKHHNDSQYCKTDRCYYDYALYANDLESCSHISEQELSLQMACKAIMQDSPSVCDENGITFKGDICYENLAYYYNDSYYCTLSMKGSLYGKRCLMHFAVVKDNPDICLKADPESALNDCLIHYATITGDSSACQKTKNSLMYAKCYIDTAYENGDPASCNPLTYQDRQYCLNRVIREDKKVPIKGVASCSEVNLPEWRDMCLSTLAWQERDKKICDLISDDAEKQKCIFKFD